MIPPFLSEVRIVRTILIVLTILLPAPSITFAQAVWRGREYSHPVCNNPNCRMCNSIRSQLYTTSPQVCQGPNCNKTSSTVTTKSLSLSEVRVAGEIVKPSLTPAMTEVVKPSLTHVTELVPTPEEALQVAIELLNLSSDSILVEPGCGDGRLLAKASLICPSFGIELNQESAIKARINAPEAIVMTGDALIYHYETATHLYMYLYPELMEKIIQKLKNGTKIVSYMHTSPSIQWKEYAVASHKFYIGVK